MNPINLYIATIEDPHEREALENLRIFLHEILPDAEESPMACLPSESMASV